TKLEISIASSIVKELSPLVLYLRYLAKPGELLIIDEPEMNLHPEAQAKIIEFLAILANAGLNILITTHSPYVMDHLANLIKASEHDDRETISKEFYLQRTDAFISKDRVAVYLVEDRQTKNALDEEGVIQWSTFGEVSDRISDIYFKL
ncbi:MAG: AAA family ATPase, partial [Ktedonobacteraceae bacterium]